jgi:D-glycero-D-manno-heptose 1,7-bisphosphate phosphatase
VSPWAVFFDRDGVLTDAPVVDGRPLSPTDIDGLVILPHAVEAIAVVHELGALAFLVTNQPDVARGLLDPRQLDLMHDRLTRELQLDAVRVCPHDGVDRCRKPEPGMLFDLAAEHRIDLTESYMVGDRWVDVAAGSRAGTTTILVERPYSWQPTSAGAPPEGLAPDHRVSHVLDAARIVRRLRRQDSSDH